MEQCWAGEPSRRPLLGAILPVLKSIQQKAERGKSLTELNKSKLEDTFSAESRDPALALSEPNNQRGRLFSPLPSKRKSLRSIKPSVFPMTNIYHASACSNFYIQLREF